MPQATVVHINLDAIASNVQWLRQQAQHRALCAVVKSHAYGHGMVQTARTVLQAGAKFLGVMSVEEGQELRAAGIQDSILVWGRPLDGYFHTMLQWQLTPVVSHIDHLKELKAATTGQQNRPWPIHVEIDTGLTRMGLPIAQLDTFMQQLQTIKTVQIVGLMSHMATEDMPGHAFNHLQKERFVAAKQLIAQYTKTLQYCHIGSSPALLSEPNIHTNLVRCGLMLYGLDPMNHPPMPQLQPALQWHTTLIAIHDLAAGDPVGYGCRWYAKRSSRIGTLAVGYADGYPRCLSNKAQVLIHGQRAPVVGTICMDMCMVDLTDVQHARIGDAVVLLGQQKNDCIDAQQIATWANTIAYEIVTGIRQRVPRIYKSQET